MTNHPDALSGDGTALNDTAIPADAFIYPDEPLVLDKFRAALIHPDEPLTPRTEEGGIVVGLDGSAKQGAGGPGAVPLGPDQVADLLDAVSMDLRRNGIVSLIHKRGASSIETNLRTHLAEYFSK